MHLLIFETSYFLMKLKMVGWQELRYDGVFSDVEPPEFLWLGTEDKIQTML